MVATYTVLSITVRVWAGACAPAVLRIAERIPAHGTAANV